MSKRVRQYKGLCLAILSYYIIHEGAHLMYALKLDVFKKVNFIGLGLQIDVFAEKMTENQLGIFCIIGSVTTMITAYMLVAFADKILQRFLRQVCIILQVQCSSLIHCI